MYDQLVEKIRIYKFPQKEQSKIINQKQKETELHNKKIIKYNELMDELNKSRMKEGLSNEIFDAKSRELQEKYKEIKKPEKNSCDYVTDIALNKFEITVFFDKIN